jgi:hypothetical protein
VERRRVAALREELAPERFDVAPPHGPGGAVEGRAVDRELPQELACKAVLQANDELLLFAQGRDDAAEKAVARAVSLDARLGSDPAAALAARRTLPPDPVFGERPDAGPASLAARTNGILARVFRDADAGPAAAMAGGNWIADLWLRRFADPAGAMPAAVAAR